MWKKADWKLQLLTVFNVLSIGYIVWEYRMSGGVTYFLTTATYIPFSLVVFAFDLLLAIGSVLAVMQGNQRWWKVGILNYAYAIIVDVIVMAKLFFGANSTVIGRSELWLDLMIYGGQLAFFGIVLLYWLSIGREFRKK